MTEQSEYVTVAEACKILGVSRATLDLYVRQKRLTRFEQGAPRRTVYSRSQLEEVKRVRPKKPPKP